MMDNTSNSIEFATIGVLSCKEGASGMIIVALVWWPRESGTGAFEVQNQRYQRKQDK